MSINNSDTDLRNKIIIKPDIYYVWTQRTPVACFGNLNYAI